MPPAALISWIARSAPKRFAAELAADGPVSDMKMPTLIGPVWATAMLLPDSVSTDAAATMHGTTPGNFMDSLRVCRPVRGAWFFLLSPGGGENGITLSYVPRRRQARRLRHRVGSASVLCVTGGNAMPQRRRLLTAGLGLAAGLLTRRSHAAA